MDKSKKPPLGSGKRFQNLKAKLSTQGAKDADALAAKVFQVISWE